jgi:hypothetical protein
MSPPGSRIRRKHQVLLAASLCGLTPPCHWHRLPHHFQHSALQLASHAPLYNLLNEQLSVHAERFVWSQGEQLSAVVFLVLALPAAMSTDAPVAVFSNGQSLLQSSAHPALLRVKEPPCRHQELGCEPRSKHLKPCWRLHWVWSQEVFGSKLASLRPVH